MGCQDGSGRIGRTIDAYDEMGRELIVTVTIPGAASPYTTSYDYDLSGKPTHITPNGHVNIKGRY